MSDVIGEALAPGRKQRRQAIRYNGVARAAAAFFFPFMILSLANLTTAFLFGGMTLYSFTFAAFLFSAFPAEVAGPALRRAFPWFYVFVIGTAAVAALLWWPSDRVAAGMMGIVVATTLLVRQLLMPAINRATDSGLRQRFKALHGLSVVVTLGHIVASGWLLTRIV